MSTLSFRYSVYGLRLRSEFPLPELISLGEEDGSPYDVTIQRETFDLPDHLVNRDRGALLKPDTGYCYWRHTGLFRLQNGQSIVVQPAPGVTDDLLRPFLLGPVLASLLHQRGSLIIHASAVALSSSKVLNKARRAVAFVGQSHTGKSTVASALYQRGHDFLSDDVIAIPVVDTPHKSDPTYPQIFPGLPHLKLRPPSIAALGHRMDSFHLWHPTHDNYLMRLQADSSYAGILPAPLRSLYVLKEGSPLKIEPMESQEALMALVNNSFCVRILQAEGKAHNFLQCAQLLRQVPIFQLQRPVNLDLLGEIANLIEDHQKALSESADE